MKRMEKGNPMKWLETIELRSAGSNNKSVELHLRELINNIDIQAEKPEIKFYTIALIDSDFCIHFFHDTEEIEKDGSRLGQSIVSALKEHGLVNHSIWLIFK